MSHFLYSYKATAAAVHMVMTMKVCECFEIYDDDPVYVLMSD
jgi:hypothetical protein